MLAIRLYKPKMLDLIYFFKIIFFKLFCFHFQPKNHKGKNEFSEKRNEISDEIFVNFTFLFSAEKSQTQEWIFLRNVMKFQMRFLQTLRFYFQPKNHKHKNEFSLETW